MNQFLPKLTAEIRLTEGRMHHAKKWQVPGHEGLIPGPPPGFELFEDPRPFPALDSLGGCFLRVSENLYRELNPTKPITPNGIIVHPAKKYKQVELRFDIRPPNSILWGNKYYISDFIVTEIEDIFKIKINSHSPAKFSFEYTIDKPNNYHYEPIAIQIIESVINVILGKGLKHNELDRTRL